MTLVERSTRRFLSWAVVPKRSKEVFETVVDTAPPARNYHSDAFSVWGASWYPGEYAAHDDKTETYSVEGGNAELRHYLARLARSNRCFSRCIHALTRAVDLFVRTWNTRQEFKKTYPKRKPDLRDFIPL